MASTREVIRKDNFISIAVKEGEKVNIAVDGAICAGFVVPYDCEINTYVKRDSRPIQFIE